MYEPLTAAASDDRIRSKDDRIMTAEQSLVETYAIDRL